MKTIKSNSEILIMFLRLRDSAKANLAQAIQAKKGITFWTNRLALREMQVKEWEKRSSEESAK